MANAKISQLPAVTSAAGSDLAVAVASGTTSQVTVDNLFKNRTLVAPALGTPASGNLSNCTALPLASVTGLGTGVATALATNVGSAGAPVVLGGALGTPSSGTLSSCSGLPISTGVSGLGTNVATALATNVGSAGAPVVLGGALGTPSSGTLSSCSGLPISTGVSGLGTNVATALATNVGSAGAVVVNGGALGTPATGDFSSGTFTWPTFNQSTSGNAATTSGTNVIDCTASLPTATLGKIATLSNVTASGTGAWGETVAFGGAATYLCFANGTNWTIIGA